MSYCPNCGHRLNNGDLFCPQCGKPICGNNSQDNPNGSNDQVRQNGQRIQLNITREKAFVAALVKYRVYYNGAEAGSLANGDSITIKGLSSQKFLLKVQPRGDTLALHRMVCEIEIDPSRCKTNIVNCRVVTKPKLLGAIAPLLSAPGKIHIYVDYQ